jgi:hypothetical protein
MPRYSTDTERRMGSLPRSDGSVEFNYRVKDGLLHLGFRDGVVIRVCYEA